MSIQVCFIPEHPISEYKTTHPAYLLIDFPSFALVQAISRAHDRPIANLSIDNVREMIAYSPALDPFVDQYAECDRLSACYSIRQRHATKEDIILGTCKEYLSSGLLSGELDLPAPLRLESYVEIIECTDSIRHYIHKLNP